MDTTDTSLIIKRVYKTDPETLFDIWTDPVKVKQWHQPASFSTMMSEADAKVGGKWKIGMRNDDSKQTSTAYGEFISIEKPHKLVYSWQWEHDPSEHSQVTVEFNPVSEGTELVLTHERLSGPESVAAHGQGWQGVLANLEQLIK
jgi:uncharacterized protein YndB with AHSA1/START domain